MLDQYCSVEEYCGVLDVFIGHILPLATSSTYAWIPYEEHKFIDITYRS